MTKEEIDAMDPEERHAKYFKYVRELEGDPGKLRDVLDMKIVDADYGYVKIEMPISEKHRNPIGTVHGGAVFSLCDTCGGSCNATLGDPGPTISADIHYIGSMVDAKVLTCECRVIKAGKRVNVLEQTVCNEKGQVVAICTQQYMKLGRDLREEAKTKEKGDRQQADFQ